MDKDKNNKQLKKRLIAGIAAAALATGVGNLVRLENKYDFFAARQAFAKVHDSWTKKGAPRHDREECISDSFQNYAEMVNFHQEGAHNTESKESKLSRAVIHSEVLHNEMRINAN
jgi:hypothetical protein